MPYYYTCPLCGANLDPNERCDCSDNNNKEDNNNVRNQDHDQCP